jgi:hypothetical protein
MCGRRERETNHEGRRDPNPSREADFLVLERWKASWSSGKRCSSRSAAGTKASVGPSACSGILHCKQTRRRQRMSGGSQGGERRRHAHRSACTERSTTSSSTPGDASFGLVLRLVHVDPHYAPQEQSSVVGRSVGIVAGQTRASGKNQHRGPSIGRSATRCAAPPP